IRLPSSSRLFLFSYPSLARRYLHSFPTRRSSDLVSVGELLGLDAIRLLNNRSYLIFFLSSIAICIPLAFYYNFTNAFLTEVGVADRKSTRLNSSHVKSSYAVFRLKKKKMPKFSSL